MCKLKTLFILALCFYTGMASGTKSTEGRPEPKFKEIEPFCAQSDVVQEHLTSRGYEFHSSRSVCQSTFFDQPLKDTIVGEYACLHRYFPTPEKLQDMLNAQVFAPLVEIVIVGQKNNYLSDGSREETYCILKSRERMSLIAVEHELKYLNSIAPIMKQLENSNKK